MKPSWVTSNKSYVWVFNTGRGLASCIRIPGNHFIIYDLGCSEDFSPVDFYVANFAPYLRGDDGQKPIAQLILSHPHVDHIQEARAFGDCCLYPTLVTAPNANGEDACEQCNVDFGRIRNDDNSDFIDAYEALYERRKPPLMTINPESFTDVTGEIECGLYFMRPPAVGELYPNDDQLYVNGLSLCHFYRHNRHTLWMCGDVTPEVHRAILAGASSVEKRFSSIRGGGANQKPHHHDTTSDQPSAGELFAKHGLDILVAPHHGLESCYCEDVAAVANGKKVGLSVVSEKRHLGESDGTVDSRYSSEEVSRGLYVDVDGGEEFRRMVSTRNGHHILMILGRDSPRPKVYLRRDPEALLNLS